MKTAIEVFEAVLRRIRYLPYHVVQSSRILLFRILSTAHRVDGKPYRLQPVLLAGQGRIVFDKSVHLGVKLSPFLYTGYIHIEARTPHSLIEIADRCWFNNNCVLVSEGEGIMIGADTIMGTNVEIYDSDFHDLDPMKRMKGTPKTTAVHIGSNVFVGSNMRLLKGVSIGENSVIGNGSVVTSPIPANVVAVGNPAKVIRSL